MITFVLRTVVTLILHIIVVCKTEGDLSWLFIPDNSSNAEPLEPERLLPIPLARHSPRDLRKPTQSTPPSIKHTLSDGPTDNVRVCPNDRICLKGQYCDLHFELCRDKVPEGQPCRRDEMCHPGNDCMHGYCRKKIKRGREGARCRSGDDCGSGMCCAPRHGQHVCQKLLQEGDKCYVPEGGLEYSLNGLCPCGSGLVCRSAAWRSRLLGSAVTRPSATSDNLSAAQGHAFIPSLILAKEGLRCVPNILIAQQTS